MEDPSELYVRNCATHVLNRAKNNHYFIACEFIIKRL